MAKLKDEQIGFIGGGTIAFAIGSALIAKGFIMPSKVYVSGPHLEKLENWRRIGANVVENNGIVVTKSDIIFICVKPHIMYKCSQEVEVNMEPWVCKEDKLFVSVITGVSLDEMELAFNFMITTKMVRAIPNIAVEVCEGCTVYAPGHSVTAQDLEKLELIFATLGMVQQVPEDLMNALTALIACSPAYIFTVIKAMSDGVLKLGIPPKTSLRLAAQTAFGAAKLVLETNKHPAVLRDEVCTYFQPTIFGIHELEKVGIRDGFMNAIALACQKNSELGNIHARSFTLYPNSWEGPSD